jgi:hypothetical protein
MTVADIACWDLTNKLKLLLVWKIEGNNELTTLRVIYFMVQTYPISVQPQRGIYVQCIEAAITFFADNPTCNSTVAESTSMHARPSF